MRAEPLRFPFQIGINHWGTEHALQSGIMTAEEWEEFVDEKGSLARAKIEGQTVQMRWFEIEAEARFWWEALGLTQAPAFIEFRTRAQMLRDAYNVRNLPWEGDVFALLVPDPGEDPTGMTEIVGLVFREIIMARFADGNTVYVSVVGKEPGAPSAQSQAAVEPAQLDIKEW